MHAHRAITSVVLTTAASSAPARPCAGPDVFAPEVRYGTGYRPPRSSPPT